jgi:thiol-disulfide isomerase/thioredoxin
MLKTSSIFPALMIIVLLLVAMPKVFNLINGPAVTPGVFDAGYTLAQAAELSKETGKPMFVLVTADWCPPCQKLKRSTLTEQSVIDWVKTNAVPVYLEDGTNPDEIASLPVRAYPTTLLIQDGQILTSIQGAASAGPYVKALTSAMASIP